MKALLFLYNIMTEAEKQLVKETVWAYIKVIGLLLSLAYLAVSVILIFG